MINSYLCIAERKVATMRSGQLKFAFRPAKIYGLPRE